MLQRLVERGSFRRDLDTVSATWMILSMAICPRLLEPIHRAMGDGPEAPDTERWIAEVSATMRAHMQVN
jgi:hypothetical protein